MSYNVNKGGVVMLFHSIEFLVFFPIVVLIFFVMPRKMRTLWLLIASCYFYISWNPRYAVWINVSTVIAYAAGLMIEESHSTFRTMQSWQSSFQYWEELFQLRFVKHLAGKIKNENYIQLKRE